MDYTLPETLQSIIGTIGMKNVLKGYKIYSEGGRTNIVIQFVECEVQPCSPNLQSSTNEFQANGQLKPAVCSPRHRSTSNRARDFRRVQCHKADGQNVQLLSEKSMQSPSHEDLQFASQTKCKQSDEIVDSLTNKYESSPDSGVNETQGLFANPLDNHDEECFVNVETESESETVSDDCIVSEPGVCKQSDESEHCPSYADLEAVLALINKACAAGRNSPEYHDDRTVNNSKPLTTTPDAEPGCDSVT